MTNSTTYLSCVTSRLCL